MPLQVQYQPYSSERLFSVERKERIETVCLRNLDFSNGEKIEYARKQITEMGIWDSFLDRVCNHGTKKAFLENLADKILLDKADIWRRGNPGRHCEYPRSDELRSRAFRNMLRLLSPEGRKAMLDDIKLEGDAITVTPKTGIDHLDKLLSIKLAPQEAESCFVGARMHGAASAAVGIAVSLIQKREKLSIEELVEAARLSSKQAKYAKLSLSSKEAVLRPGADKRAWGNTAEIWRQVVARYGGNHREAAQASMNEALAWQAAGKYENEAKAWCDRGQRLSTMADHEANIATALELADDSKKAYEAMETAGENARNDRRRSEEIKKWTVARYRDIVEFA